MKRGIRETWISLDQPPTLKRNNRTVRSLRMANRRLRHNLVPTPRNHSDGAHWLVRILKYSFSHVARSSLSAFQSLPEISSLPIESATPPHRPADKTICLRCCRKDPTATSHPQVARHRPRC